MPEPNIISIIATMITVILPSNTDEKALWKPESIAARTDLPSAISSFILSAVMMLASTPIPIDRITAAIPGRVNVNCGTDKARS